MFDGAETYPEEHRVHGACPRIIARSSHKKGRHPMRSDGQTYHSIDQLTSFGFPKVLSGLLTVAHS